MTTTYEVYNKTKREFFEKHDNDYFAFTSPMDDYGRYSKIYYFTDGGEWYEQMTPVEENNEKLLRTEFWSSEFGSRYYYEKF